MDNNGFSLPFSYTKRAPPPTSCAPAFRANHGLYKATTTAVAPYRGGGRLPEGEWSVGLLCKAPNLDGVGFQEPNWPGYQRQPNGKQITFVRPHDDWTNIVWVGVFIGDKLCFYGRLANQFGETPDPRGPREITIEWGDIYLGDGKRH